MRATRNLELKALVDLIFLKFGEHRVDGVDFCEVIVETQRASRWRRLQDRRAWYR